MTHGKHTVVKLSAGAVSVLNGAKEVIKTQNVDRSCLLCHNCTQSSREEQQGLTLFHFTMKGQQRGRAITGNKAE